MISKPMSAAIPLLILMAVSICLVGAQTFRYMYVTGGVTITAQGQTEFYVNQLSNIDSSADKGTHGNFTAQQYGPDLSNDTLTEENTGSGSDTLWLYVNSNDTSRMNWDEIGTQPYLDVIDHDQGAGANLITTSSNDNLEGDFFFIDSGKSTEPIISVSVQIYGYSTDQNLEVCVWNGSSWPSLGEQALPSAWGWVNYTATAVLDTWTKIDAAIFYLKTSAAATYNVDCARLQVEYDSTAYEVDLEVQWISLNSNRANEELCIYGGEQGAESLQVDVWDGASWQNVIASLNSGWNNITVSAYLTSSTFTACFKGTAETADATQDSWIIDVTLLHVWT